MTLKGSTQPKRTVVIVDDDPLLCASLVDALSEPAIDVFHAQTGGGGMVLCRERVVDVVLLDQNLPDGPGVSLCPAIMERNEHCKIIFMTAYPTFENAVAALKVGASDYISKPFELDELRLAVNNALRVQTLERIEQLHCRRQRLELEGSSFVGDAPSLREHLLLAEIAATSDAPVLISGETGTGKTLLARYIHYRGPRRDQPFVSLNCAALPETLAESELFGHDRGAFTGAVTARRGIFEMAEGGTVFLDEIGAMPVHLQAKLLGVLEDRTLRRIGSETVRRVSARVLAATNTDLDMAVRDRAFRQDLYYRLSVIRIHLPALRDRLEDLPELCRHLTRRTSGHEVELPPAEVRRLAAYPWPGNVRELSNILERAALVQRGGRFAPSALLTPARAQPLSADPAAQGQVVTLAELERRHIELALEHYRYNLTRAAQALGIALSTLKRKVREHGLRVAGRK